jgi:mannose-1-phosphate guanylyltransferase/mannose-6-phosphate isomerase
MTDAIIPALMVGGSGSRLWPLSRPERPKQFLVLQGDKSLFQNTVLRVQAADFASPWILANGKTLALAEEQLAEIKVHPAGYVVEQVQIGTAAAIATLLCVLGPAGHNELVLVLPSDHLISRPDLFQQAVVASKPIARWGKIVTFGIVPTAPETGFGYIRPSPHTLGAASTLAYSVQQPAGFVEKPNESEALTYIKDGYFWNAGIFLFSVGAMLQEFETHAPDILASAATALSSGSTTLNNNVVQHVLDKQMSSDKVAAISIDKAILEKSRNIVVVPCEHLGWRDMGTLSAVQKLLEEQGRT